MSNKPTELEYLLKLIPSTTVIDEIERYAILNNKSGVFSFNDESPKLFFYTDENSKNNYNTGFKRAIFRVYSDTYRKAFIGFKKNDDEHVYVQTKDNSISIMCDHVFLEISSSLIDSNTEDIPYYYIIAWCKNDVKEIVVRNPYSYDLGSTIVGVCF